jgi:LPXTG-site transpeptidase (sortase) family protein
MNAQITQNKNKKPPVGVFLSATIVMFFLTLSAADSVGFVPCQFDNTCDTTDSVALSSLPQLGVTDTPESNAVAVSATPTGILPTHIKIPSVGIDLNVQNPSTTDVDALDALLNKGPAHYVSSADLGQSGNMIIFAHSSHLPIVTNKMFQAFNQVPNVEQGASIEIDGSDGKAYLYSVDSVVKADTQSGTTIDLSPTQGTKLTLVTCDTLTGVSARFILTADFVGVVDQASTN